jgi:acyl carrier protein
MATVLEIVSEYIRTEVGYKGELDPDVDLLATQVLDSYNIVQVAIFLQERFGVELEAEDLVRANLAKLSSIVALVDKRMTARSS